MKIKLFFIFIGLLLLITFFVKGFIALDPDFGWHLRNGEIFLTSGIFYKDPYSYTMPSFPVVSHSWLSEIIIAIVYKILGFYGLSLSFLLLLLGAILAVFLLSLKEYHKEFIHTSRLWHISFLISSVIVFINLFYVRPQVISWVMWSFFVLIVFKRKFFQRLRYILPLIFLLWSNLHGDFALALFVFFLVIIFISIRSRKIQCINFLILIVSFLLTLVNPFGLELWREVFMTILNMPLRLNINEWRPIFNYFDISFLFLISFSTIMIWRYKKNLSSEIKFIYAILLVQGLTSIKNIPFWVIFNLLITPQLIYFFYKDLQKNKLSYVRFGKAGIMILGMIMFILCIQIFIFFAHSSSLSETYSYPKEAVLFLKTHLPKGEVFSTYGWGGYLIWKLPEKKVFIDGRMAIWNWNANKPKESNNAFSDYLNIVNGTMDFQEVVGKYNIGTVLWSRKDENYNKTLEYKLETIFCHYIHFSSCFLLENDFSHKLLDTGWKIVYKDNVATIYQR